MTQNTPPAAGRRFEPMALLVWGLPLAAVIAGLSTVWIAVQAGGSDTVRDSVRRVAQVQTTNLARDEVAARRGLSADLRIDPETHALTLQLQGDGALPEQLRLVLGHPSQSSQDQALVLVRAQPGTYLGRLQRDPAQRWHLQLDTQDGDWRLVGTLDPGAAQAALMPAVAARADGG